MKDARSKKDGKTTKHDAAFKSGADQAVKAPQPVSKIGQPRHAAASS